MFTIVFTFGLKPVKSYDIHVEYPAFSELENHTVENFINNYIENEVNRYVEDFEDFVLKYQLYPLESLFNFISHLM